MKRISSLVVVLLMGALAQQVVAQPKARLKQQADGQKAETTLSERAKAQYTGQMPAPDNVVWKRDIYRTLDLQKEKNAALYYPVEPLGDRVNLFTLVLHLVVDGKVPAYEYRSDGNELFTEANKFKVKELLEKFYIFYEEKDGKLVVNDSDVPSGEVLSYFIKESSYYDQRTATYNTKVTAICPVLHRSGDFGSEVTKYPMFWLNYDEVSPYFGMTQVMTSSYNNISNMSLDDYFAKRQYEGEIYKTANLQNKLLAQYCKTDSAMKAEQLNIEKQLTGFENDLWGIEEPDTTLAVKDSKNKKVDKRVPRKKETVEKATKSKDSSSSTPARVSVRRERR